MQGEPPEEGAAAGPKRNVGQCCVQFHNVPFCSVLFRWKRKDGLGLKITKIALGLRPKMGWNEKFTSRKEKRWAQRKNSPHAQVGSVPTKEFFPEKPISPVSLLGKEFGRALESVGINRPPPSKVAAPPAREKGRAVSRSIARLTDR
jgi:hypothetical protein